MRVLDIAAVTFCIVVGCATPASAQTAPDATMKSAAPVADEALYPPPSARWKVVAAGLGTSALAYGAAAGLSYGYPDAPGARDLRAPFLGPWLAIAHNGCSADEPDCSKTIVVIRSLVTAIDGIAQAGGIAVALEGLFMTTQVSPTSPTLSPAPSSPPAPRDRSTPVPEPSDDKGKNLFWLPTPMTVGLRGVGVGVVGRF